MSAAIIEAALFSAKHLETQVFEKKFFEKKEQGTSLALTIVSTLFPRKFRFDF